MPKTLLLCITGCIAAYKSCEITRQLQKAGIRVKVCMTEHATAFVGPTTFRALTHEEVAVGLFDDPADPIHHISLAKEPDAVLIAPATANVLAKIAHGVADDLLTTTVLATDPADPIHHISLAKEPDAVLIAPATANVLAKIAHGVADDLLTTTVLATDAPVVIAPAMNVGMWQADATCRNIRELEDRGYDIVRPATGYLACGDTGEGKLADVDDIVARALLALEMSDSLAGERVIVTAGGTREAIDPVRYIGNRSTGKMGHAIARAARAMGAEVTLVTASTSLSVPYGVTGVRVESAAQMHAAVSERFDDCTMLVCAAAVADYTPAHPATEKLSKADVVLSSVELVKTRDILADMSASTMLVCAAAVADYTPAHPATEKLSKADVVLSSVELVKTRDILADMSARKGDRIVIGFAAETNSLADRARAKLGRKGCDAIVANDVSRDDSTFGSDTDSVLWVTGESVEQLPCMGKQSLAFDLLKRAVSLKSQES